MKKIKTKKIMPVSIDRSLAEFLEKSIINRSKYIEYLIYKDFQENNAEGIKNILL